MKYVAVLNEEGGTLLTMNVDEFIELENTVRLKIDSGAMNVVIPQD